MKTYRAPLFERFQSVIAKISAKHETLGSQSKADAIKALQQAELPYASIHVFLGVGNGSLLNESLHQYPDRLHLVVEKDPVRFFEILQSFDWTDFIRSPNVHLYIDYEVRGLKRRLFELFDEHKEALTYIQGFADPRSLSEMPSYYDDCNRALEEAKGFTLELTGYSSEDSWRGLENTINNLDLLIRSPQIEEVFGKFSGQTAISVAGGPSVDEAWPLIEAAQGKIPIIAVDTVLKPFHDRGLRADFITALERDPIVADLLRGIPVPEGCSLIAPHLLLRSALEAFAGQKVFFGSTARYLDILGLNFLRKIYSGSSAGNLNLTLAAWMGFSRVIMVGHNLAFAEGSHQSHLKGTIDPEREKPRTPAEIQARASGGIVRTQDGKSEVYTLMEYNMFRHQIENLIFGWPKVEWINLAAKGAAIDGAKLGSVHDLTSEISNMSSRVENSTIATILQSPSDDEIERRRQNIESSLARALSELKELMMFVQDLGRKLKSKDLRALEDMKVFRLRPKGIYKSLVLDLLTPELFPLHRGMLAVEAKFSGSSRLNDFMFEKNQEYLQRIEAWIPRLIEILGRKEQGP